MKVTYQDIAHTITEQMPIENLKRVMQILWLKKNENNRVDYKDLRMAVYECCGYDPRTLANVIQALKDLKWIKATSRYKYALSKDYLVEDF